MTQCIAFITAKNQNNLLPEDILVAQKLRDEHAVKVLIIPWGGVLPKACKTVVLRSCHDYPKHLHAFKEWLQSLEQQSVQVLNSLPLIRNNIDKSYLLELQKSGVSIVPTVRIEACSSVPLTSIMTDMGWDQIVIKPAISVGANDTFKLDLNAKDAEFKIFNELLAKQSMLVQQFIPEVTRFGEISLVYFHGRHSHAVSKKPSVNDFRVQERFGGNYQAASPHDFVLKAALNILELLPCVPTYARVDGVVVDDVFLLMELELIEPRLYLSTCSAAVSRFTNAIISDTAA